MKKFFIKTFGCRLNQYQSEKLREWLSACNLYPSDNPDEADLIIVNGCVVTHRGERDTRKYISKYAKRSKKVIATGCYINLPHVHEGNNISFLSNEEIKKAFKPVIAPILSQTKHRVLIGIQEGCNFRCTYCIVPYVRGRARDRDQNEILEEVKRYVANGAREIVITGTEIGGYGKIQGTNLAKFIRIIKKKYPALKIRLSSILPLYVTDDIIALFREQIVLPHVHLPLQSGSPMVLKDMKRPYKIEKFLDAFSKLHNAHPHMAIGTDIIVGYPTEKDSDFMMTYRILKELPFAYAHIFLYSRRPMTEAESLHELPYDVIKERERILLGIAEKKRTQFLQKFTGKVLAAMVEKKHDNKVSGTTENYIKFEGECPNTDVIPGTYVNIRINKSYSNRVTAEIEGLL